MSARSLYVRSGGYLLGKSAPVSEAAGLRVPPHLRTAGLAGCWLCAAVPVVALIWAARRYGLDFPWAEDWAFCEIVLVPMFEDRLTWRELCTPLHGYAKLSTWALRAPLAALTRWNHGCEVAVNVLLGLGILAAFLETLRQSTRIARRAFPHVLVPLFAVILLGLDKSVIWFWGDGMTYTLAVCASTAGMASLAVLEPSWRRIAFAAGMGAISVFAFASGLLYLVTAALVLCASMGPPRRRRALAIWGGWSLILAVLYVAITREEAAAAAETPAMAERLWVTLRFLPVYLGAGLTKFHLPAAQWLGIAGLCLGGLVLWRTFGARTVPAAAAMPFVSFMLFALLAGAGACLVRYRPIETLYTFEHDGFLRGAIERYPFFSQFYWASLVGLLWLHLPARDNTFERHWARATLERSVVFGFAALLLLLSLASSRTGYYEAQERYEFYGGHARRVVEEDLEALPDRLQWPYGNERREALATMRAHNLSIFRDAPE